MNLAMIYMASGFASRFGENKLLFPFRGKPLYCHGLEHLQEAAGLLADGEGKRPFLAVVSQYREILEAAGEQGLCAVPNHESREGITASLKLGTRAAGERDAYLYFVADQPFMRAETICAFVRGFAESGKGIGCVTCGKVRGNPVIFSGKYRENLLALRGDRGGRQIMEAFPEDIWFMETETRELFDIDRREDLKPQADGCMGDTNCMACRDAAKIEPAERRGGYAYGKAEK